MSGKFAAGFIVIVALLAGAAVWYTQVYAYYVPVVFTPGQEIRLTPIEGAAPEPILVEGVTGIDADSSPLRFRACFTTPQSLAMLTETYQVYPDPTPLIAPGWFDCFDAKAITEALEKGEAIAFLSEAGIHTGVDRVVAVFPDGRAYAWNQLSPGGQD